MTYIKPNKQSIHSYTNKTYSMSYLIMNCSIIINTFFIFIRWNLQNVSNKNKNSFNNHFFFFPSVYIIL